MKEGGLSSGCVLCPALRQDICIRIAVVSATEAYPQMYLAVIPVSGCRRVYR